MEEQYVAYRYNEIVSALKKNAALIPAPPGMGLEDIKLSKMSQIQKHTYSTIPLM